MSLLEVVAIGTRSCRCRRRVKGTRRSCGGGTAGTRLMFHQVVERYYPTIWLNTSHGPYTRAAAGSGLRRNRRSDSPSHSLSARRLRGVRRVHGSSLHLLL